MRAALRATLPLSAALGAALRATLLLLATTLLRTALRTTLLLATTLLRATLPLSAALGTALRATLLAAFLTALLWASLLAAFLTTLLWASLLAAFLTTLLWATLFLSTALGAALLVLVAGLFLAVAGPGVAATKVAGLGVLFLGENLTHLGVESLEAFPELGLFLFLAQFLVLFNGLGELTPFFAGGAEGLGLFLGEIKGFPEVWLRFWLLLVGAPHAGAGLATLAGLGFAGVIAIAFAAAGRLPDGLAVGVAVTVAVAVAQGVGRAPVALAANLTPAAGFLALLRVDDGDQRGSCDGRDEDVFQGLVFHD